MRGHIPPAYRLTLYKTNGADVRIGRRSPAMDQLLTTHRCRTGTFVTAYNPYSRRRPEAWNRRMQKRLLEALSRCTKCEASGGWRNWSEAHVVVLGDPRPVLRLARLFRQNAVVIVGLRQRARLVSIF